MARRRLMIVGLAVKPVGEPDAGNPHVRFDERGRETEQLPQAQATAPFLDSTPLMSVVKPRTRKNPPSPETREKLFCDDRATVGAQPGDVGEQTLIRGFSHDRIFVRGFPCLRPGVDLTVGLIGCSGIPLAVATLPPLHNMIAAHCPSAGSLSVL